MNSVRALALLTEEMKSDDPERVMNKLTELENDLDKSELLSIIKELLWGIKVYSADCILEDTAIELDGKYDEEYQNECLVLEREYEDYKKWNEKLTDEEAAQILIRIKRGYLPNYDYTGTEDDFEKFKLHMAMSRAINFLNNV